MTFIQLLCDHIWKERVGQEILREVRDPIGFIYADFYYKAIYKTCILCGKKKIIERRFIKKEEREMELKDVKDIDGYK